MGIELTRNYALTLSRGSTPQAHRCTTATSITAASRKIDSMTHGRFMMSDSMGAIDDE
jgi:hypothetical protein